MNNNKIAFITCVKNVEQYERMIKYIQALIVPVSYYVEIITITEEINIALAYNQAINVTDAKYKIYINEEVYITNNSFIEDFINIFKENPKIGMLGMAGTKVIPTTAICLNSRKRCGKIYGKNGSIIEWDEIEGDIETVEAIDGFIMITQYDVFWREDLFKGSSYYDVAHNIEFKKNGYDVAVIKQELPWCQFLESDYEYEEVDRQKFLDEYSKDIFPLVSILIPTYNRPEYFEIALKSALTQTYRNIEVVIGDGSDNNDTKILMEKYKEDKRISYFHNRFLEYDDLSDSINKRWEKIFNDSNGEYINWLMDDDCFHKEKIEKMINFYLEYENITLVTSHRQIIDDKGNFMNDIDATNPICEQTTIFPGSLIGKEMLKNITNFIGEPTTVLIKKSNLKDGYYTRYLDYKFKTLFDVNYWLELLNKGNCVYICETLSYFRIHAEQAQNSIMGPLAGLLDWHNFSWLSYNAKKFLLTEEDYKISLKNINEKFSQTIFM